MPPHRSFTAPFSFPHEENINRVLKGTLRSMEVEDAHKYSTHAFRRGASMELKRSGSTFGEVLKTVGWNSASFRSYLSFVEDEAANIRLILAYDSDESEGEGDIEEEESSSSSAESTSVISSQDALISNLLELMNDVFGFFSLGGAFSLGFRVQSSHPMELTLESLINLDCYL